MTQALDMIVYTPTNGHLDEREAKAKSASTSQALIIHPLRLRGLGSPLKPLTTPERQHYKAYRSFHEYHLLLRSEQIKKQKLSLFDYTCDENITLILGYLDGMSLCATKRVCHYLKDMSDNDDYWYNLCKAEWAIIPEELENQPESYQALYKYACKSLKLLIRDFIEEQSLNSMQTSFRIPRDTAIMIAKRVAATYS
jgi:hypothetical protein